MVLLTTTPPILDLISSLPASTLANFKTTTTEPLPTDISSPVSHSTLIALSRLYRKNASFESSNNKDPSGRDARPYSLNTLLRNTQVYTPPPPPKPAPSPEYIALMTRLRAEAERKQYRNLLLRADRESQINSGNDTEADEDDEDPISPSLVMNIFLSIICCGFAVFYVSRWWGSPATRVLLSLATGIVVGIAEVVVYAAYIRNVKTSRKKEKRKKERKVVIGEFGSEDDKGYDGQGVSVIIRDREEEADSVLEVSKEDVTEDIIWGRGKHGGMRRRVREKWEKETQRAKEQSSSLD